MNIEKSIRLLIIRLAITYFLFFIVIVGGLLSAEYYLRSRVADSITQSVRESILSNSFRSAVISVGPLSEQFTLIQYIDHKESVKFQIPSGDGDSVFNFISIKRPIWVDSESKNMIGYFRFSYRWTPAFIVGCCLWGLTFLFGIQVYFKSKRQLLLAYKTKLEMETSSARGLIAEQLAHDIRSPLAALQAVVSQSTSIEPQNKMILEKSAERISSIAENLLKERRERTTAIEVKELQLNDAILEIVAEKRILHPTVNFNLKLDSVVSMVNANEFKRIISNLLNNSIEALTRDEKRVSITLKVEQTKAKLSIVDTGKGIPKHLISELFKEGRTIGKSGGNGLGLFHAKKSIENWAGEIELLSDEGIGTTINIYLPCKLFEQKATHSILIDDDALVRIVWESKARSAKVELKTYASVKLFERDLETIDKESEIYIDQDLPDGVKGIDYAKALFERGFKNLTLATGHEKSQFGTLPHLKKIIGKEAPW